MSGLGSRTTAPPRRPIEALEAAEPYSEMFTSGYARPIAFESFIRGWVACESKALEEILIQPHEGLTKAEYVAVVKEIAREALAVVPEENQDVRQRAKELGIEERDDWRAAR